MDTTLNPKHAKPKRNPLTEMREQLGGGEEWNPVEEVKKNVKGALKVASEVPQNLANFATDPSGYLKRLLAKETPEHLGQMISGGYGPGNVGGLAGITRATKGGNWWPGSVERNLTGDIKKSVLNETGLQNLEARQGREVVESYKKQAKKDYALNRWIDKKLHKYVQNEMGSPEDSIRKMAEAGKDIHVGSENLPMESDSFQSGEPMNIISTNPLARQWESTVDFQLGKPKPASEWKEVWPRTREGAPEWLHNLPDETPILNVERMGGAPRLGFDHLVDELRNAMDPASGLPQALRFTPEQLDKITVPQAVERVAKINEWRNQQRLEISKELARNPATEVVKEYPDNNPKGLHWVELRAPKTGERIDDGFGNLSAPGYAELEQALKYEGDAMGHCVGGYCDPVFQKRQRIFSLRDKDGEPHVTIEMQPAGSEKIGDIKTGTAKTWEIHQVKGKGNGKPKDEYIPYVQDFVKSQGVNVKRDLKNTELVKTPEGYKTYDDVNREYQVFDDLANEWVSPMEHAKDYFGKNWEKEKPVFMSGLGDQISSGAEYIRKTPYAQEVLPAAEREANLQAMQAKSAAPGDWFHGTSRDIKQFDPKQAGATFLTRDPKFAEDFAYNSNAWMGENIEKFLTPEQLEAGKAKAIELMKQSYGTQNKPHQKNITAEIMNSGKGGVHASGEAQDFLTQAYKDSLPSGPNIMKVHTAVKNPWDYENPSHVADLLDEVNGDPKFTNLTADQLSKGSWGRIEGPDVQEAIKSLGHDAFYVNENGTKNLGVYDPALIKSATGNEGTYDLTNPEINKKDGGSVKIPRYSKQHRARQYAAEQR